MRPGLGQPHLSSPGAAWKGLLSRPGRGGEARGSARLPEGTLPGQGLRWAERLSVCSESPGLGSPVTQALLLGRETDPFPHSANPQ